MKTQLNTRFIAYIIVMMFSITGALAQSGANKSLSNLTAPTAVNIDLLPATTNTINLGSSSLGWKNMYLKGKLYLDGKVFLDNSGTSNTWVGNTGNTVNTGTANTAVGFQSLFSNTSGYYNTASGYSALYSNTTGSENTATGFDALYYNVGNDNTANGYGALTGNITGYSNTATGVRSLYLNTTGYNNTAIGYSALNNSSNNHDVTAIGFESLYNNAGDYNTAVGYQTLLTNTSGYNLTAIGINTDVNASNYNNVTLLGQGATGTASSQVRIGSTDIASIGGYVNWTNISDGRFKKNIKEDVKGLEFINKLQPVTYTLDIHGINNFERKDMPEMKTPDGKIIERQKEDENGIAAKEKTVYSGFIAQDVEKAAKEVGYDFSGVDAPKNDKDVYGLRYAEFVVPLVKAVQELSSQNDSLKLQNQSSQSTVASLQNEIAAMKTEIQQFDQSLSQCCTSYQSSKNNIIEGTVDLAKLEQNLPNPFSENTLIQFYLPRSANSAVIKIYSLDGVALKSFDLNQKGYGEITLDGNALAAGVYAYTLLIDGKAIDTKQMILTK